MVGSMQAIGKQTFRPWLLVSWVLFAAGCERDQEESAGEPPGASAPPAGVPSPPPPAPAPPKAFVVGKWQGAAKLETTELGGPVSGAPQNEEKPIDASSDANEAFTLALQISDGGRVTGTARLSGSEAVVSGEARLDEGPVRLAFRGDRVHGVTVLHKEDRGLSGTLRLSVERGEASSDVQILTGQVRLTQP